MHIREDPGVRWVLPFQSQEKTGVRRKLQQLPTVGEEKYPYNTSCMVAIFWATNAASY